MMSYPPTGTHAGACHNDCTADDLIDGHGLCRFPREVQSRQIKRIAIIVGNFQCTGVIAFRVPFKYAGNGNRHGRIQEDIGEILDTPVCNTFAQVIENLLGAFQREGGNNDIAAPPETRSQRHIFRVLQQAASCWSAVPPVVLEVSHPAHKAIYSPLSVSLIPYSLTFRFFQSPHCPDLLPKTGIGLYY